MREATKTGPKAGPGRGNKRDSNISSFVSHGTSQSYTLARLKRDRPDLADMVVAGELSPNAAAIEAGFRRKKVQVEPTIEGFSKAVRYLVRNVL